MFVSLKLSILTLTLKRPGVVYHHMAVPRYDFLMIPARVFRRFCNWG